MKVAWPQVLLGMAIAIVTGAFMVFGAWVLGMLVSEQTSNTPVSAVIAILAPALIYAPAYFLLRKRYPDFARGFVIGASIVVILGGTCNAIFLSMVFRMNN